MSLLTCENHRGTETHEPCIACELEQVPASNTSAAREKQVAAIASEISSLRTWLESVERDLDAGTVVHAMVLVSIAECCAKLLYGAGMLNGRLLQERNTN